MERDQKEIWALINLLDDPNDDIFKMVSENLLEHGPEVIPDLEQAWENAATQVHQERLENLIQQIQFQSTEKELKRWITSGATNLLEGAYLITKFQYPDLTYQDISHPLESIKKDVWLELNDNLTALEKVRILNHIIFDVHKFTKNTSNFFNPQNSFINQVIQSRKGNPISLAIIYSHIAQQLGLPVYGVNLPRNFILAYKDESGISGLFEGQVEDILFYINPYNNGAVLGKKEIDFFLMQQKIESQPSYYLPCSNLEIIKRVVNNLINSYEKLGYQEKILQYEKVNSLLS